jgi:peroxiredoxin
MKKYLILIIGLCCGIAVNAQQMMVNKFILPDGREITPDKLDSVKKAWNGERILFQHNEGDDKNKVMHLVRMTPEMAKELEEANTKQQQIMADMIGKKAPDFSLKDMNGKLWTLSELKGKAVVLNFWFTSCPPCNQEMPELNQLVKDYQGKNVMFLALTFNDVQNVNEFFKNRTFAYTILPSSKETDKLYQISSWPTSLVIARDGKVAFVCNYEENIRKTLSEHIDKVL